MSWLVLDGYVWVCMLCTSTLSLTSGNNGETKVVTVSLYCFPILKGQPPGVTEQTSSGNLNGALTQTLPIIAHNFSVIDK